MGQSASFRVGNSGSVMIETALFLPVLAIILFGAFDLVRFVQLTHKSEQLTHWATHQITTDRSANLGAIFAASHHSLMAEMPHVQLSFSHYSLALSPEGDQVLSFREKQGDAGITCPVPASQMTYDLVRAGSILPTQYFAVLILCVRVEEAFFMSEIFSFAADPLVFEAIAVSSHPDRHWNE